MPCRACGLDHAPTMRCEVAKRLAAVVHKDEVVVHEVVHAEPVVVHGSRHGVYKDAEARKAYRKEWMRKDRERKRLE